MKSKARIDALYHRNSTYFSFICFHIARGHELAIGFSIKHPMKIYITTPIIERAEKTYQEKLNGALERINSIKGHFKAAHGVQIVDVVTCITEAKISPSEPNFESLMMGKRIQTLLECDAVYLDLAWFNSSDSLLEWHAANDFFKDIIDAEEDSVDEFLTFKKLK